MRASIIHPGCIRSGRLTAQRRNRLPGVPGSPGSNATNASSGEATDAFALDYDVIIAPLVTHNAIVSVRRDFRNALFRRSP